MSERRNPKWDQSSRVTHLQITRKPLSEMSELRPAAPDGLQKHQSCSHLLREKCLNDLLQLSVRRPNVLTNGVFVLLTRPGWGYWCFVHYILNNGLSARHPRTQKFTALNHEGFVGMRVTWLSLSLVNNIVLPKDASPWIIRLLVTSSVDRQLVILSLAALRGSIAKDSDRGGVDEFLRNFKQTC